MGTKPTAEQLKQRRENVRRAMADANVDALFLAPGANLYYLTGYWGHISRRMTGFLLGAGNDAHECFICPAFEQPLHGPQLIAIDEFRGWEKTDLPEETVLDTLGQWGARAGRLALDPKLPWDQAAPFTSAGGGLEAIAATSLMARVRMVKSSEELDLMREATRAAAAARGEMVKRAALGVAENDLEEVFIREASNVPEPTDTWNLVLFGPSAASPHGVKDRRQLRHGDVVLHDFGTTRGRYHSDTTRTAFFGEPAGKDGDEARKDGDEARKVWEIVHVAYETAKSAARPGVTFTDVDEAARRVITDAGYGDAFIHGIGHGIGLEIHEPPYPEPRGDLTLEFGTTMTIEPGIYLPGRFGVRLEDTVVVTEEGGVPIDPEPPMGMAL